MFFVNDAYEQNPSCATSSEELSLTLCAARKLYISL